jgi:ATP-dependent Clp protease ATP-binding subunit ClpX
MGTNVMGTIADLARKAWPMRRGLRCSFCGRDAGEVARLVAGASAYICDDCVIKCVAVLDEHGGAPAAPGR